MLAALRPALRSSHACHRLLHEWRWLLALFAIVMMQKVIEDTGSPPPLGPFNFMRHTFKEKLSNTAALFESRVLCASQQVSHRRRDVSECIACVDQGRVEQRQRQQQAFVALKVPRAPRVKHTHTQPAAVVETNDVWCMII